MDRKATIPSTYGRTCQAAPKRQMRRAPAGTWQRVLKVDVSLSLAEVARYYPRSTQLAHTAKDVHGIDGG